MYGRRPERVLAERGFDQRAEEIFWLFASAGHGCNVFACERQPIVPVHAGHSSDGLALLLIGKRCGPSLEAGVDGSDVAALGSP